MVTHAAVAAANASKAVLFITCALSQKSGCLAMLEICFGSGSRCVPSENIVSIFTGLVAGPALFVRRQVAGFAVRKVGESPAARRGVLFRVLDHELNVQRVPGKGRLEPGARETFG